MDRADVAARGVDRNPAAPAFGPKPLTNSTAQARAGVRPDPLPQWWDEIPHVDSLLWPVGNMPYTHLGDQMWRYAPELRTAIIKEPSYGDMVREALDYVIARRPTTDREPPGPRTTCNGAYRAAGSC
ncbi:hypothetical protein [Nocardia asiatica]|uniref:hypothetical protein n=1 Tax=Nocardia asiatica TaxID=209252 RepID=UPI003EE3353A